MYISSYAPCHLLAMHGIQSVPFQAVGLHIQTAIHAELSEKGKEEI